MPYLLLIVENLKARGVLRVSDSLRSDADAVRVRVRRARPTRPSPVVELNRAVAVAMAFGPAAGLDLVDALTSEPSLRSYHPLPSVRGELLAKLGRFDEARAESERAAALTRNARERDLLLARAAAYARGSTHESTTEG